VNISEPGILPLTGGGELIFVAVGVGLFLLLVAVLLARLSR
jgi:hypothetical protein